MDRKAKQRKAKMVSIISFRIIIPGLLFLMQSLGDPFTHAYQGKKMNVNAVAAAGAEKSTTFVPNVAMFGGRKEVVDRSAWEEIREHRLARRNTEVQGMEGSASKESFEKGSQLHRNDHKKDASTLHKSRGSKVVSVSAGAEFSSLTPEEPTVSQELQKMESQRLLKAAHEMVSMLHKDYRVNGKPRRKPPVNN